MTNMPPPSSPAKIAATDTATMNPPSQCMGVK